MISGAEALGYIMRRQRPAYGRWIGYIICLLGFGGNVVGQGSVSWDPVKTVCNILHPRGVIVENKMYVDGGEVIDRQNYYLGTDKPYYNTGMIRWQSRSPFQLVPHIHSSIDCHFIESDTHIPR